MDKEELEIMVCKIKLLNDKLNRYLYHADYSLSELYKTTKHNIREIEHYLDCIALNILEENESEE